jgi:hypothetical protein
MAPSIFADEPRVLTLICTAALAMGRCVTVDLFADALRHQIGGRTHLAAAHPPPPTG